MNKYWSAIIAVIFYNVNEAKNVTRVLGNNITVTPKFGLENLEISLVLQKYSPLILRVNE